MEAAADATFALMTELGEMGPLQSVRIALVEAPPERARVVWRNRLLPEAHGRAWR